MDNAPLFHNKEFSYFCQILTSVLTTLAVITQPAIMSLVGILVLVIEDIIKTKMEIVTVST